MPKSALSHSEFRVWLLSHSCTCHTKGGWGGQKTKTSIYGEYFEPLEIFLRSVFELVPAAAQLSLLSAKQLHTPAGCGLSGRLVPVPMFPAGGPLHGELVDVSTVPAWKASVGERVGLPAVCWDRALLIQREVVAKQPSGISIVWGILMQYYYIKLKRGRWIMVNVNVVLVRCGCVCVCI